MLLLLYGDVEVNPGPIQYPCGICGCSVRSNQKGVQCDLCDCWFHAKCESISCNIYSYLTVNESCCWLCTRCALPQFDDSLFNVSDMPSLNVSLLCQDLMRNLALPVVFSIVSLI